MTRPSIKREGIWTLDCREHTQLRSNPDSKFACDLCDIVRVGPVLDVKTMNLAGFHSIKVLIPSKEESPQLCMGSSVEVSINAHLRYSIWGRSRAQFKFLLVKKMLTARKTLREQRTKGPRDAQPGDNLRVPNQSTTTN